ncbi:hypothetical protein KAR91_54265 [Candidatus Pacearchaeota archaeon]|nr:hypothetical protein [Candidatus Pacearchaeota archaeon]
MSDEKVEFDDELHCGKPMKFKQFAYTDGDEQKKYVIAKVCQDCKVEVRNPEKIVVNDLQSQIRMTNILLELDRPVKKATTVQISKGHSDMLRRMVNKLGDAGTKVTKRQLTEMAIKHYWTSVYRDYKFEKDPDSPNVSVRVFDPDMSDVEEAA